VSFTTGAAPTAAVPVTVTGPCGKTVSSAGLSIVTEIEVPPGSRPSTATAVPVKTASAAVAARPAPANVLRLIASHPSVRRETPEHCIGIQKVFVAPTIQ
jgi:hypothetical protein